MARTHRNGPPIPRLLQVPRHERPPSANTLDLSIPVFCDQWGRRESNPHLKRLKDAYAAITPRPRLNGGRTFHPKELCHLKVPSRELWSAAFSAALVCCPPTKAAENAALHMTLCDIKAGREALESSSAALQTAAIPSQLPTQNKKARHLVVTPGLASFFQKKLGVTSAEDERGGHSPTVQPDARPICVVPESRRPASSRPSIRSKPLHLHGRSSLPDGSREGRFL
jgi:hypothetical protein